MKVGRRPGRLLLPSGPWSFPTACPRVEGKSTLEGVVLFTGGCELLVVVLRGFHCSGEQFTPRGAQVPVSSVTRSTLPCTCQGRWGAGESPGARVGGEEEGSEYRRSAGEAREGRGALVTSPARCTALPGTGLAPGCPALSRRRRRCAL